jgi:hypothetical protein
VPLTELQKEQMFAGLADRRWVWREGFIYAPHGTMWLSGSRPWEGDLREFHERMVGRLQRNMQAGWMYEDAADHRRLVEDTGGLVDTLADMLSASDAEPSYGLKSQSMDHPC